MESSNYKYSDFKGRNRRLLHEWQKIESLCQNRSDIDVIIRERNNENLPIVYEVIFHLKSICCVENLATLGIKGSFNPPIFHDTFKMKIELPYHYPSADGIPLFRFCSKDDSGEEIPVPWHPNIQFFGPTKGQVCLNRTDTFTDLALGIDRISEYLKYHLYHASLTPPFPEDLTVAKWVREQGEPNNWLEFTSENK